MVSVKWRTEALNDLEKIDFTIAERVLSKVSWLEENFPTIIPEQLGWNLRGLYKLRVGDYRVVYSFQQETVIIQSVKHRSEAYKK
jgi:mRNA interferase RelE/StbE